MTARLRIEVCCVRPIRRRALKGEPRDELDKPLPIPRKLCRVGAASDSFEMPGGRCNDWTALVGRSVQAE